MLSLNIAFKYAVWNVFDTFSMHKPTFKNLYLNTVHPQIEIPNISMQRDCGMTMLFSVAVGL